MTTTIIELKFNCILQAIEICRGSRNSYTEEQVLKLAQKLYDFAMSRIPESYEGAN